MSLNLPSAMQKALGFEEKKLANGLTLRVLPMPEYTAAHVIFAANIGSIHRAFEQNGKKWELPAGVAHFLEHKMFENEDGVDAFELYGETGAAANAYTSFERTSYVFTATSDIEKNLDILLSFVSKPYFTEETIKKEQGIIGQEIKMYEDSSSNRAVFAMLSGLYHSHPIRDEIGGSVESISGITPEMLYACTDAFYNPSNMVLTAAGNVSMQQLYAAVQRAGLPAEKAPETKLVFPPEPESICQPHHEFTMPIAMPVLALGFKESPPAGEKLKTDVMCDIITELICGETSTLYHSLYNKGLIQPNFGADYGCYKNSLFFMFAGAVTDPTLVRSEIMAEILRLKTEGIDENQFDLCKNMMYGEAVKDLESVERMASILANSYFDKKTPAEEMAVLTQTSLQDVQAFLNKSLNEEFSATVIINPEK